MIQLILNILIFIVLIIPIGKYLYKISSSEKTLFDPLFDKVDNFIYKSCNINKEDMSWKRYTSGLIITNTAMIFIGYIILRIQGYLTLNPNDISNMEASLSFNTIISFMTNTNLQHYS